MKRLFVILGLVLAIGSVAFATGDQEQAEGAEIVYPSKNLTIVVPYPVGGSMDTRVRIISKYLGDVIGKPVVVENRKGASGMVATTEYLIQKPNTHKLISLGSGTMTVAPLFNEVSYALDDFIPIIGLNFNPFGLFTNPAKSGISSLGDLIAYGKNNNIKFGSGGPGGDSYLVQDGLYKMADAKAATVPYGGASEGLTMLLGGHIDVTLAPQTLAAGFVQEGSIVPIATYSETSYKGYPNNEVPSVKSLGYDIVYEGFAYIAIRKGTNPEIVEKLHDALETVFAMPEFQEDMKKIGVVMSGLGTDQITELLNNRFDLVKELNRISSGQ